MWTVLLHRAVHALSVLALALWLGGFTFYSALVIPVLHDQLGSTDAGFITQRVTNRLNIVGAAAVALCCVETLGQVRSSPMRRYLLRSSLLAVTSVLLLILFGLHRIMDDRLAVGRFHDFYPLHRAYLITSTLQWAVNIPLLLIVSAASRSVSGPGQRDSPSPADSAPAGSATDPRRRAE